MALRETAEVLATMISAGQGVVQVDQGRMMLTRAFVSVMTSQTFWRCVGQCASQRFHE